jgi:hypothetical protein
MAKVSGIDKKYFIAAITEFTGPLFEPVEARFRLKNQSAAGICVFKNSLAGRFTYNRSDRFQSKLFVFRPSPLVFEVNAPFANTTPACPVWGQVINKMLQPAKLALPTGGTPYCQRASFRSNILRPIAHV